MCVCVYIFPPKCVRFLLTSSRDDDDDPKSRTVFVLHEQKHSAKFLPKILPRCILFVGVVLSQRRQRRQRERLLLLFNQNERKNISFQRILTFFGLQLAIYVKFVRFQMCVEIYMRFRARTRRVCRFMHHNGLPICIYTLTAYCSDYNFFFLNDGRLFTYRGAASRASSSNVLRRRGRRRKAGEKEEGEEKETKRGGSGGGGFIGESVDVRAWNEALFRRRPS